jgi:putative hydrolase of the HAD superfamily
MAEITTIFFDVGGVLLSNGWDTASRRAVVAELGLDWDELEDRHQYIAADFEMGKLTLDQYLDRTVFYRERRFDRDRFFECMKAQSVELPGSMAVLGELSSSGRYRLATLNNESRELNEYRIEHFGLRDHFSLFLSSAYLGLKKPEPEIFALALDVTGVGPGESVFVDDRPLNLECAGRANIETILFTDAARLRGDLRRLGVQV